MLKREGLRNTPKRAAAAFKFLTQRLQPRYLKIVNNAISNPTWTK